MKKFFLTLLFLIIAGIGGIFIYYKIQKKPKGPKPQPVAVSQYSAGFNESITALLTAYENIGKTIANNDTTKLPETTAAFIQALALIDLKELEKDTIIHASVLDPINMTKESAETLKTTTDKEGIENSYAMLSENLRLILIIVKYDYEKLHWMECADAEGKFWISRSAEKFINPYVLVNTAAKKDCGVSRTIIDFVPAEEK